MTNEAVHIGNRHLEVCFDIQRINTVRNYLVHVMLVASSLLAVTPGCRDSANPKDTLSQSIVGKWIQEMASQPSVMQTEFFKDGTLTVLKYTVLSVGNQ